MKTSVKAGIVLAVLVAIWTLIFGFTGMYKSMLGALVFPVVAIVLTVGVIVWGLRQTRDEGRRYGGQVAAGLVIGIVAAVLLFFNSLLFTSVLFPNYTEDIIAMQEEFMTAQGMPADAVAAQMEKARANSSPMRQAVNGAIGTVVTSLVVSLIVAAFVRKKD